MSLTKVTASMTTGLAGGSHAHPISGVTNLQTFLDAGSINISYEG